MRRNYHLLSIVTLVFVLLHGALCGVSAFDVDCNSSDQHAGYSGTPCCNEQCDCECHTAHTCAAIVHVSLSPQVLRAELDSHLFIAYVSADFMTDIKVPIPLYSSTVRNEQFCTSAPEAVLRI
jgi:hypothetical protein